MPKKRRNDRTGTSVRVGNISGVHGELNIAGRDVTTHRTVTGLSVGEVERLFEQLYSRIEARPETSPAVREDLKAEVKDIQETVTEAVQKDERVEESFLARRFRNIARMAPDILELIVATLANPLAGLGVAVKKIGDRAKEEAAGGEG